MQDLALGSLGLMLLRLFLVALLASTVLAQDYPRDLSNVDRWSKAILTFSRSCAPAQRAALEQIVADAAVMRTLDVHKAYDALEATVKHLPEIHSPISNFGPVVAGRLWRGAQPSRAGLLWLARQGIRQLIVLREPGREETNYPGWSREDYLRSARALGFSVVELPIRDTTGPTPEQIAAFFRAVDESGQTSFMHCSAGIGRTGVMAGLYLRSRGASAAEALNHARSFMLQPEEKPDHAVQAAFFESYPCSEADPEPVEALFSATGQAPELVLETPDFKALAAALGEGRAITFVFTPENLDQMGALSCAAGHKKGRTRGLTEEQVDRVRLWLGVETPLEVSD